MSSSVYYIPHAVCGTKLTQLHFLDFFHNFRRKPISTLSLEDKAIRSLIYDYLSKSNLRHSLAVFAPESQIDSQLSPNDILRAVGLNPLSKPYQTVLDTKNNEVPDENADPSLIPSTSSTSTLASLIGNMISYVNTTENNKNRFTTTNTNN